MVLTYLYVCPIHISMSVSLSKLDEAITSFRVATQRPAYARRILDGLGFVGGVASLRVMRVVQRLTDDQGGPSIRRVADELGVEHSTASRSVDALVKSHMLVKNACINDLRSSRLALTPEGQKTLDAATARRQAVLKAATTGWAAADVKVLSGLLARLTDGLDGEVEGR